MTPKSINDLNWDKIRSLFPSEIEQMENCAQDPKWHKEGNVWIHTQKVIGSLLGLKEWQALNATDQNILFLASLLHDVGKPSLTQTESDGHITSRGHSKRGAQIVRKLLRDYPLPPFDKEMIRRLVGAHSLPCYTFLNEHVEKSVIRASLTIRCDLVIALSKADVIGRISEDPNDQKKTLDNIDLFEEYCKEYKCLNTPYQFPSNHTRFMYFRKANLSPIYEFYDDTEFEVILMVGLPGVGKDTYIKKNLNGIPVLSLDELRYEMDVAPTENQSAVISNATEIAKTYLRSKTPFVFNATNITKFTRSKWIDLFYQYKARTKIVYLESDFNKILERNKNRKAKVPEEVIAGLYEKMDVPDLTECHKLTNP